MNLNQLKLFYAAVKYGSFSAAAARLCITQPAVTKGVQRLQDFYEVELILRAGKQITLTPAGRSLYKIAEKIFKLENRAEDCMRGCRQLKKTRIVIHSTDSFGEYYLPILINRFSTVHPEVRISLRVMMSDEVIAQTEAFHNDIGFVSQGVYNNKLHVQEVFQDALVFALPCRHPHGHKKCLMPADLQGETLLRFEKESVSQKALEDYLRQQNLSPPMPIELASSTAIKNAVIAGAGIALISSMVVAAEVRAGKVRALPPCGKTLKRSFYMVRHKDKYLSCALKKMLAMVDSFGAEGFCCADRQ